MDALIKGNELAKHHTNVSDNDNTVLGLGGGDGLKLNSENSSQNVIIIPGPEYSEKSKMSLSQVHEGQEENIQTQDIILTRKSNETVTGNNQEERPTNTLVASDEENAHSDCSNAKENHKNIVDGGKSFNDQIQKTSADKDKGKTLRDWSLDIWGGGMDFLSGED